MKLLALASLALLVPLGLRSSSVEPAAAPAPSSAPASYLVDGVHSSTVFRVQHITTPFWGRFNKLEGALTFDAAAPESSKIEISIDAASVDTNDAKRDEHLRGADFFSAKEFPKMTFKSTRVAKKAEGKFEVTGDFTFHGVTKSIAVPVEYFGEEESPMQDRRAGFEATFEIKRSEYGVAEYIPVIGDSVRIIVALECIRQKAK
jgi:polyisoprenoid-binding protein YceI